MSDEYNHLKYVCVFVYIYTYLNEKLQNTNSCWAGSAAVVYNDK